MHRVLPLLQSALTAFVLVDASSSAPTYNRVLCANADNFFSYFTAYTGPDPTDGSVNYTDLAFAEEQRYVKTYFNPDLGKNVAYIGADHTSNAPNGRNSVRLSSNNTFSAGTLLVLDVAHVPVGWGQWSALWLLGTDGVWPASGEIDIFESVHNATSDTITLHTAPGCTVEMPPANVAGTLSQTDCNAGDGADGCSTAAPAYVSLRQDHIATAGTPLNQQGGAVFVTEWTTTGVSVWIFARAAVPAALNTLAPSTADFPPPVARFAGADCDFATAFRDMALIVNIDFCGDWAGKIWASSGAAAATGVSTCAEYVSDNPRAFAEAYFEIISLEVYSSGPAPGVNPAKRDVPPDRTASRAFSSPHQMLSAGGAAGLETGSNGLHAGSKIIVTLPAWVAMLCLAAAFARFL